MEDRIYLILDSQSVPLANAVLESPANSEVLQIRVLGGKEEKVAEHREIQLIGLDDSSPNRVGVIVRQRGDQMVIQPTAALGLFFHRKNGFLDRDAFRETALPGAAASLAGALIAAAVDVAVLRRPFGLFLLYSGASMLWSARKKE